MIEQDLAVSSFSSQPRRSRLTMQVLAVGAALFLSVGRWSPAGWGIYAQPRIWIVVALSITAIASRPRVQPGQRRMIQIWILLAAWLAGSFFWAIDFELASLKLLDISLIVAAVWATYVGTSENREVYDHFLRWFGATLAALGVVGILALAAGQGAGRLSILGGGPNVYGRNMAVLSVGLLAYLFLESRRPARIVLAAGAAAAGALVLASGSRGALLALGVGSVASLGTYLARRYGLWNVRSVLLLIVGSAIALAILLSAVALLPGDAAEETFERRITELTIAQRYDAYRYVLWDRAASCAAEYPVAGSGLAGFTAQKLGVYPHNISAEIACEQGSIGLLLAFAAAIAYFVAVYRRLNRWGMLGLVLLLTWLTAAQFSGDLYDARGVFLLAGLTAAITPATSHPVVRWRTRRSPITVPYNPQWASHRKGDD